MDLINETELPAELFRSTLQEPGRMLGIVVAKATYHVAPSGRIDLDLETPIAVSRSPIWTPSGELPGDAMPRKEGVDLVALGRAQAPGEQGATSLMVSVRVGSFTRQLAIFGERRWLRLGKELVPSLPQRFRDMPMQWEYAYGGEARIDGAFVPNPDNPQGRGYLLEESAAEGSLLPNIEDPEQLIHRWNDQPRPICLAPVPLGTWLHAEGTVQTDPEHGHVTILPGFFNVAHPKLRLKTLEGGESVELAGMSRNGPLAFTLPRAPLRVDVQLEQRRYTFPIRIDTLYLLPEERRFCLVYRCGFTYRYVPGEVRTLRLSRVATLLEKGDG